LYLNEEGNVKELPVENKKQRIEDDGIIIVDQNSADYCYVCNSDDNPQLMIICDLCDYYVAHTYCVGFGETIPDMDWICGYCDGIVDDDSYVEGESLSGDDDLDDLDVDSVERNFILNSNRRQPLYLQRLMEVANRIENQHRATRNRRHARVTRQAVRDLAEEEPRQNRR